METTYHNTIPIEGEELKKAQEKALTQQEQVLQIFKRYPDRWFTPYEIQAITGSDRSLPGIRYMLITSIRRSITNLTNAGYLIKGSQDLQVREKWSSKNNRWRYRT